MKKFFNSKGFLYTWISIIILIPIILWILPADYFDAGESLCPSKRFFDVECFGCGITKAVMHFHHFDFSDAIFYNYLVVAVYPLLVFLWAQELFQTYQKIRKNFF